jgi:anti-sigma-K factor RskA
LNIEEYISSGILEAYVLGQLDAIESAKVDEIARQYPLVREELNIIESAFENYANAHAVAPAPDVKKKVFEKLFGEGTEIDNTIHSNFKENKDTTPVISISSRNQFYKSLIAASVTIAIISLFAAFYFRHKWRLAENSLVALQQENSTLASTYNQVKYSSEQKIKDQEKLVSSLLDTNSRLIKLKGLPTSPNSNALVVWNKSSKEVLINVKSLPAAPSDQQYQLWALDNGVPIDAGVFEVTDSLQLQKLKTINSAQAFAVTLEKRGGSVSPTLSSMVVMGAI